MRSYLTRFDATAAAVDGLDPSVILMPIVFGVTIKTNFALEKDSPMELMEFYYEAKRYLRQKNT